VIRAVGLDVGRRRHAEEEDGEDEDEEASLNAHDSAPSNRTDS
jgi:hypothetical protein